MELGLKKNDVNTKLRLDVYYNELEIGRLMMSDEGNHKEKVETVCKLLCENAQMNNALRLLEEYFPAQQQPVAPPQPVEPEQL